MICTVCVVGTIGHLYFVYYLQFDGLVMSRNVLCHLFSSVFNPTIVKALVHEALIIIGLRKTYNLYKLDPMSPLFRGFLYIIITCTLQFH